MSDHNKFTLKQLARLFLIHNETSSAETKITKHKKINTKKKKEYKK